MRVFITGATGALGEPVTRRLVEKGYVTALSRSDRNRARLTEWGAMPVDADLFDPDSLSSALRGCEAVLHLATKIPPVGDLKKSGAWAENDRIRRDGMNTTPRVPDPRTASAGGQLSWPSYGGPETEWICFFSRRPVVGFDFLVKHYALG